jgi:hypothetical protein
MFTPSLTPSPPLSPNSSLDTCFSLYVVRLDSDIDANNILSDVGNP